MSISTKSSSITKKRRRGSMHKLELTEEELQFIYDRCSRKAARLEESNLKDTPCYRLSWAIMNKINEAKKPAATEEK